mmetsp:Transcript_12334/g.49459  ORF Transcript_12334/g.49459 Transcript_12334/m.49459 type:complete len:321 (+) Transcript_12334:1359-2321(+)
MPSSPSLPPSRRPPARLRRTAKRWRKCSATGAGAQCSSRASAALWRRAWASAPAGSPSACPPSSPGRRRATAAQRCSIPTSCSASASTKSSSTLQTPSALRPTPLTPTTSERSGGRSRSWCALQTDRSSRQWTGRRRRARGTWLRSASFTTCWRGTWAWRRAARQCCWASWTACWRRAARVSSSKTGPLPGTCRCARSLRSWQACCAVCRSCRFRFTTCSPRTLRSPTPTLCPCSATRSSPSGSRRRRGRRRPYPDWHPPSRSSCSSREVDSGLTTSSPLGSCSPHSSPASATASRASTASRPPPPRPTSTFSTGATRGD